MIEFNFDGIVWLGIGILGICISLFSLLLFFIIKLSSKNKTYSKGISYSLHSFGIFSSIGSVGFLLQGEYIFLIILIPLAIFAFIFGWKMLKKRG